MRDLVTFALKVGAVTLQSTAQFCNNVLRVFSEELGIPESPLNVVQTQNMETQAHQPKNREPSAGLRQESPQKYFSCDTSPPFNQAPEDDIPPPWDPPTDHSQISLAVRSPAPSQGIEEDNSTVAYAC